MTPLTQSCVDFGELVQDVQECIEGGEALEQLSSKGLAALLFLRHLGFSMFETTETGKANTAKARHAFDEKTLVLQNILYERGYYQKEIQEAAEYKSRVSNSELELMSVEQFQQFASEEFTAGLDPSSQDYDHQLILRRLDHELHTRRQARKQLSELKMRRDALQTNLGQKRKAHTDLRRHISQISASTQNVRQLFALPDAPSHHNDLAQLLPLPLHFILTQATAILDTLSTAVKTEVVGSQAQAERQLAADSTEASYPAKKRQRRASSLAENDLYQAFPLTVELHLTELSLHISFAYLPSLGLVTAEADSPAGNELLATLFEADSGVDTPNEANKYIGEDIFVFDAASTARPYRWAQWLAGLDFLPQLPAGLFFQGTMSEQGLQSALARYRRERRATHILATLVQRTEESSELGQQLKELSSKRLPLQFPNRLFQQLPPCSIHIWQEMPRHVRTPSAPAAAAVTTVSGQKPSQASTADKPEDPEEGEEGELSDAPEAPPNVASPPYSAEAMDVDTDAAKQDGHVHTSSQAPVPLGGAATSGSLTWGHPLPDASSKVFKMVLKSQHGWQLDGQITVYSGYPAVPSQVTAVAIKESYNPLRPNAGSNRQELAPQAVSAVQQEVTIQVHACMPCYCRLCVACMCQRPCYESTHYLCMDHPPDGFA
ncbi:hypothetical protein ABBQ32_004237 [Trebouxia sp. C0010 RCD-2024]